MEEKEIESSQPQESEPGDIQGQTPTAPAEVLSEDDKLSQQIEDILNNSPTQREKVLRLKALAVEPEDMIKLFGLPKSTVYAYYYPKMKRDKAEAARKNAEAEVVDNERLPIVLKNGKGEVLSPEAVYHKLVLSDGIDGERDFRALMKWAASIEMVQRMTQIRKAEAEAFAETVKPMLDMMEKSRQELDAAAARARESSMEIAEVAAAGAAARATMRIDERFDQMQRQKKDIAETEKPMEGLMARTMESMIQRMTGMMFGGQSGGQVGPTPGMVDKRSQGGE